MTLRGDAERVLRQWPAPDGSQDGLRLQYLDHLARHDDGLWQECREGHITASVLVLAPERESVLLTLHRKIRMWLQLGGHCEPDDASLAAAALREGAEESGIPGLTLLGEGPVRLDRHPTPCAWHLDVQYAAVAPAGAVEVISEESLDLRWFRYESVPEVADESVVRLLEAARAAL